MVIALTTANFPDVLLPAYRDNYWTMLFFIVYMLIGLYFLLNLLIANVFSKYKGRLEERIVAHETRRHTMVEQVYKKYDTTDKGHLTSTELGQFLAFVFDFNPKGKHGRD